MFKKSALVVGIFVVTFIGVAVAQNRGFINVSGTTLENRLQESFRQGRAGGARYWVAYSFPLRPGVVISDARGVTGPVFDNYDAARPQGGGQTPVGTRAALFLLYEPGVSDPAPVRAELSDASRQRVSVADGERVYWLGEAGGDESFSLLRRLIETSDTSVKAERRREDVAARLTDAVALHEDEPGGRVTSLLRELARGANATGSRLRAVSWLGRTAGESSFVLGVARDDGQPREVRKLAVRTLLKGGANARGAADSVSLRQLYDAVEDGELKAEIIDASPKRRNQEEVVAFLRGVESSDPDASLRERASWRLNSKKVLGEKGGRKRRQP